MSIFKKKQFYQTVAFLLTYLAHVLLLVVRKTIRNISTVISDEWTPSSFCNTTKYYNKFGHFYQPGSLADPMQDLCFPRGLWSRNQFLRNSDEAVKFIGSMDAALLFASSVGLCINGVISDRLNRRLVLCVGMILTSITAFIFGSVAEWIRLYSHVFYILLMIVSGLVQSSAWPCILSILDNWFGKRRRGLTLGVWGSSRPIGSILGVMLVSLTVSYGYDVTFMLNSSLLFAVSVIIFFGLVLKPSEVDFPSQEVINESGISHEDDSFKAESRHHCQLHYISDGKTVECTDYALSHTITVRDYSICQENGAVEMQNPHSPDCSEITAKNMKNAKAISFLSAIFLPSVIPFAISICLLKFVSHGFFFWLPFYISVTYHWSQSVSDQLSMSFDIGSLIGSITAGYISDYIGQRGIVILPMLIFSVLTMHLYGNVVSGGNMLTHVITLSFVGFFLGGSSSVIGGAVVVDLGSRYEEHGKSKAVSTICGIISGSGCLGAAIGQIIMPSIVIKFGWHVAFYFYMALTLMSMCFISRIALRELKFLWYHYLKRNSK